jgi:hypothetical protein
MNLFIEIWKHRKYYTQINFLLFNIKLLTWTNKRLTESYVAQWHDAYIIFTVRTDGIEKFFYEPAK